MIERTIEEYAEEHTTPEDEVLFDLNRKTHLKVLRPKMLSGHLQGKFLQMISEMIQPQHILEVGTFTGYATICLARGLKKGGKITTIERNAELESMIRQYIRKAGLESSVNLKMGDASTILKQSDELFDLAFIDADKENYLTYYSLIKEKIRKGGYIIVDNVLWYGKVINEAESKDPDTSAIKAFNDYVQEDADVENLMIPFRDGLSIIKKMV
ncbi:MAG TPA: O-methyltransferase [Bacteroidales bacterium]|nr:O-methyltransferase [Bacteroidales bacterium]